jgi:hypothetical protein
MNITQEDLEKITILSERLVDGQEIQVFTFPCGDRYRYLDLTRSLKLTKEKVFKEHLERCQACRVILGKSMMTKNLKQSDVAKLFAKGINASSKPARARYGAIKSNYVSHNGILTHYNTIEGVRTIFGKVIRNRQCWNAGFAHCSLNKYDYALDLNTLSAFGLTFDELKKIDVLDSSENATLFRIQGRYFINGADEGRARYIAELFDPCKTLSEAFESMKPKEVTEAEKRGLKVLRQGEYFFIPTQITDKHLDKGSLRTVQNGIYTTLDDQERIYRIFPEIAEGSRHTATRVGKISEITLVKGVIRHPEHRALKLDKNVWYAVSKNETIQSISVTRGRD